MLEVQPYAGGTSRLLSKSNPYAGGTNSCILNPPLCWRYKQLLSKSTPYAGGTNSCFLNQTIRWRYNPILVVLTPPTSPHFTYLTAHIRRDIHVDCICSCELRCCRAECVLLLGFNVHSDILQL